MARIEWCGPFLPVKEAGVRAVREGNRVNGDAVADGIAGIRLDLLRESEVSHMVVPEEDVVAPLALPVVPGVVRVLGGPVAMHIMVAADDFVRCAQGHPADFDR